MILLFFLFLSALLISSVSAFFSISGLTAIFPGAALPIISLGVVLELGKLVTASFVYTYWKKHRVLARGVLLAFTVVLSALSSVGVYGYLMKKHIEGTQGISTGTDEIGYVQKQIDIEEGNIKFYQSSLTQMDKVVNNYLTDTTYRATNQATSIRSKQSQERQKTLANIAISNKALLTLQHQKDSLSKAQRIREVDVGPLKYLAALFSKTDMDQVLRWFVLALVAVLDPLAILLVVAGNIHRKESLGGEPNQPLNKELEVPPDTKDYISSDTLDYISPDVIVESQTEDVTERSHPPKELDFRSPEKWGQSPNK